MTTRPDPVPAALFEAAVRVLTHKAQPGDATRLSLLTRRAETIYGTAERLIRQAVAGGVREEGAG